MTCAHCTLPLGRHVVDDRFCCNACASVHGMLHGAGLADTYYRLSGAGGSEPVPATRGALPHLLRELDSPVFLDANSVLLADGSRRTELYLDGVHCAACVWLAERAAHDISGVSVSRLDLSRARLSLTWDPRKVSLGTIGTWLGRFGYTPYPVSVGITHAAAAERRLLFRVGLAWALAANTMLLALSFYAGLGADDPVLFAAGRWLSLLLAVPALAVAGRVFFQRAIWSIRRAVSGRTIRHLDMDTPIALGLTVGFADSAIATIQGSGDIWFDSITLLVAALLTARWLQARSRRLASESADRLLAILPTMAKVMDDDGSSQEIPAHYVTQEMRVVVGPGEVIPVDGSVVSGSSSVDQSAMTGEADPVRLRPGSRVLAGTINISGLITCRVTAVGDATRLGNLLQAAAPGQKAPILQLADRLAGPFVATVLSLAVLSGLFWMVISPEVAVANVVALLVITCPCALGMATPLAMTVASGRAARKGLFLRNPSALQLLRDATVVVLDKTGTLTAGSPAPVSILGSQSGLSLAAAVERGVQHPLAAAIRDAATRTHLDATHVVLSPGYGVEGRVEGRLIRVGSPAWVAKDARDQDNLLAHAPQMAAERLTPVAIAIDGIVATLVGLGDEIRPETQGVLDWVRARNIRTVLLSGDHAGAAQSVGESLGFLQEDVIGDASPEKKRRLIESLQAEGHTVVMVGDGINDAPALSQADVGIAMDSGQQSNRFSSDIVITRHGLDAVRMLREGAERTMQTIRRNLIFSLGYNLVAAAAALAGLVTPLVAAIAMPVSSLAVVAFSLSLRPFGSWKSTATPPLTLPVNAQRRAA
ncbi:MAG: Cu2+-exporting ATPase [Rhodothermales bacterium]|jgi:Cu2+-exporting ATPase